MKLRNNKDVKKPYEEFQRKDVKKPSKENQGNLTDFSVGVIRVKDSVVEELVVKARTGISTYEDIRVLIEETAKKNTNLEQAFSNKSTEKLFTELKQALREHRKALRAPDEDALRTVQVRVNKAWEAIHSEAKTNQKTRDVLLYLGCEADFASGQTSASFAFLTDRVRGLLLYLWGRRKKYGKDPYLINLELAKALAEQKAYHSIHEEMKEMNEGINLQSFENFTTQVEEKKMQMKSDFRNKTIKNGNYKINDALAEVLAERHVYKQIHEKMKEIYEGLEKISRLEGEVRESARMELEAVLKGKEFVDLAGTSTFPIASEADPQRYSPYRGEGSIPPVQQGSGLYGYTPPPLEYQPSSASSSRHGRGTFLSPADTSLLQEEPRSHRKRQKQSREGTPNDTDLKNYLDHYGIDPKSFNRDEEQRKLETRRDKLIAKKVRNDAQSNQSEERELAEIKARLDYLADISPDITSDPIEKVEVIEEEDDRKKRQEELKAQKEELKARKEAQEERWKAERGELRNLWAKREAQKEAERKAQEEAQKAEREKLRELWAEREAQEEAQKAQEKAQKEAERKAQKEGRKAKRASKWAQKEEHEAQKEGWKAKRARKWALEGVEKNEKTQGEDQEENQEEEELRELEEWRRKVRINRGTEG